jgi:hypothetical protein
MTTSLRLKRTALQGIECACAKQPKARRWLRRQLASTRTLREISAELRSRFDIRLSPPGLSNYLRRHEAEIFPSHERAEAKAAAWSATITAREFRFIISAPGARSLSVQLVPCDGPAARAPKRGAVPKQKGRK